MKKNSTIKIDILEMDLPGDGEKCNDDYLLLFSEREGRSLEICGKKQNMVVEFHDPCRLFVIFMANRRIEGNGFKMDFQQLGSS